MVLCFLFYKDVFFDAEFPFRVADKLYMNKYFKNRIFFQQIAESRLKKKEYRYSDIGYYFMPQIVELITNQAFERYLASIFMSRWG